MNDPIIVTGCARSRTSLVMQTLKICGAWLGEVVEKTKANPNGQLENVEIIREVQKPFLRKHGFDQKGQYPLPPENFSEVDSERKQKVESILKKQGLKDQTPVFKDAKACLDWVAWNYAFPDAVWVIVRRPDEGIIKSCLSSKAGFMDKFQDVEGWQWWVDQHKIRFEQIKQNCRNVFEIDTDRIVNKDFSEIKPLIKQLGLKWKEDKILSNIYKS